MSRSPCDHFSGHCLLPFRNEIACSLRRLPAGECGLPHRVTVFLHGLGSRALGQCNELFDRDAPKIVRYSDVKALHRVVTGIAVIRFVSRSR